MAGGLRAQTRWAGFPFMIYGIVRVRLNLICLLETKSCLSCYPVWFFQRANVLQRLIYSVYATIRLKKTVDE
jgi:hypothetical protein